MKKASDIFGKHLYAILAEMCKRVGADLDTMDMDKFQSGEDRANEVDKPLFCDAYEWTVAEQRSYEDWWVEYLYKSAPARKELYGYCQKSKQYLRDRCWPWFMLTFCWRYKDD